MKLPSLEDYEIAIDTDQLIKAEELKGGKPTKDNDELVRYVGGFCVVFPFVTACNKKYAVRCWYVNVSKAKERIKIISAELQKVNLPYFVGFNYIDKGLSTNEGVQPIVIMDWVDAMPLKQYINIHIHEADVLYSLADKFKTMVSELHKNKISHGDLQHGNIMINTVGNIVLVDYDSMYVSGLEDFDDEIKGLEGYQHPSRWDNLKMSSKADYFSELIIYTSILAFAKCPSLWEDRQVFDTETLLFSAEDIKSKGNAPIFKVLESIPETKDGVRAIEFALQQTQLDDLLPLEEAVVSKEKKLSSQVREKWKDNGYVKEPKDFGASVSAIKEKWKDNGYDPKSPTKTLDTKQISSKWR